MTSQRKLDHVRIVSEEDVAFQQTGTGLGEYRFLHQALPEIDKGDVNTGLHFFGRALAAPLVIASMTGGAWPTAEINERLAEAAQMCGVAMGVGSQRAALENPALAKTYQVRRVAPHILLFANLGAVQLNYGYGVEQCRRAVEMIEADALILHLNPLQEAVQAHGNTNFGGLLKKIETVCRTLTVPVIAKEVSWGIDEATARRLADAGVSAIDVAGAGGTSWTEVERHRAPSEHLANIAATFQDWGIPTADSILMAQSGAPSLPIIASGGLRSGLDAAKCLALGATLASMAAPYLKPATVSTEAVISKINETIEELRITMFCLGITTLADLRHTPLLKKVATQ
ncbi:MAG: type 2 isopentenyl-diphosphate Delta-isomerase [Chloroflexi bacterium]|nr:type 2 isopentenyl-diphosphate Delta-isomerase [Chloroflexota bacterium]